MVRSQVIVRGLRALAAAALLAVVSLGLSAAPRAQAGAAGAIDALLQRASTTPPGTYTITDSTIEAAATPLPVLLQADVLRGPDRSIRVPVVVGAELLRAVDIRLRVVSVGAAGQAPRVMANATGSGAVGPLRFVHEFALGPGDYEIQAVVGQPGAGAGAIATLAKSRVTVPDVWGGTLAVTPIVIGDDAGVAPRGQIQPFTFGPTALIPALKARFPQGGAARVAFRVFNWSGAAGAKPDLTAEYLFYERGAKGLHFFNKSQPQHITTAAASDAEPAGGALTAGMVVPLAAFTFGDFQLKVTVTDNRNKQRAERLVAFTVAP